MPVCGPPQPVSRTPAATHPAAPRTDHTALVWPRGPRRCGHSTQGGRQGSPVPPPPAHLPTRPALAGRAPCELRRRHPEEKVQRRRRDRVHVRGSTCVGAAPQPESSPLPVQAHRVMGRGTLLGQRGPGSWPSRYGVTALRSAEVQPHSGQGQSEL